MNGLFIVQCTPMGILGLIEDALEHFEFPGKLIHTGEKQSKNESEFASANECERLEVEVKISVKGWKCKCNSFSRVCKDNGNKKPLSVGPGPV